MRTSSKLILAGMGATLLMAFAIGTASARNLSITNQNFRATFNNLEFIIEEISTTTCRVTLEGSLHARTIPKTAGTLIGYITRVITGQCNPNVVTIQNETLPWHVRYIGFSGRLPDITLIIVRSQSSFRVSFCHTRSEIEARFSRDPLTTELVLAQIRRQIVSTTGLGCPAVNEAVFQSNGNGSVYLQGSLTRISVTLI
jgi:hypothetical protein